MASRVPLLLKNKGRKPTRLPIAPRVKPSNADRSKRLSTDAGSPTPAAEHDDDESASAPPATVSQPELEPTIESATVAPLPPPVVQLTPRAGGIAPGGSLAAPRPSSAGSRAPVANSSTARSPVLPVQRASEQRAQQVERLAKITSAGPVYRPGSGHHVSPVLGPRATVLHPPAINTQEQHPATKRLVRKLDIKPHQSPRRAAQAHALLHAIPPLSTSGLLPAARVAGGASDTPQVAAGDADVRTTKSKAKPKASPRAAAVATATTAKKKSPTAKRRNTESVHSNGSQPPAKVARRSLRRSVKKEDSYRDVGDSQDERDGGDGGSHSDDAKDEDVDPNELDLPDEPSVQVYVPARERATMWAKSVLKLAEEGEDGVSGTITTLAKRVSASPAARRKRSNSSSSLTSVTRRAKSSASGSGSSSAVSTSSGATSARGKVDELLKKEPSQMTMGELALTVPKGKRVNRYEHEVAASGHDGVSASLLGGNGSSSLLNAHALSRVRSFSVSSESAALGGSIVTPQVEIIDGKMVILESTVKISDVSARNDDASDNDEQLPRRSGARYYAQPHTPGKRWAKDETKQFYYCLSQVGPNFSMMATLFPNRKRKELKCKFKYEEKHHPALIEIALKASTAPLDSEMVSVIAQMVDKDSKKKKLTAAGKKSSAMAMATKQLGDESPASTALGATPPPPQDEFLDDFDAFYQRERKSSFDFAG